MCKHNEFRFYLPLVIVAMGLAVISCTPPPPPTGQWMEPAKRLDITIISEPPGAEVYGLFEDSVGSLLGTTPVTFYYTLASCDLCIDEVRCKKCNDKDGDESMKLLCKNHFWGGSTSTVVFNCAVMHPGYINTIIFDTLYSKKRSLGPSSGCNYNEVFSGAKKRYEVTMEPK